VFALGTKQSAILGIQAMMRMRLVDGGNKSRFRHIGKDNCPIPLQIYPENTH